MTHKILVIDDDLDSLKLIGLLLQRQGYQVVAAASGNEGLAKAQAEAPDLILLDVMMPGMDGYQVCRKLRDSPVIGNIPVIMFTAKTRVDDKVAGFEAGADDYLTKPTHPAELASRIKAMLSRSVTPRPVSVESDRGKVVAILGVKGGTGITTLAVNLGVALAQTQRAVILADLQHGMGAVGLQLGHPQGAGLSHLLGLELEELDERAVRKELVEYLPGLRLLLTAYNPTHITAPFPSGHVQRAISLLRKMADLVLLDLGSAITGTTLGALKMADQVLLCLAPQRMAMIMAQTVLQHLKRVGLTQDHLAIVTVSIAPGHLTATPQQVAVSLRLPVAGTISAAPELIAESIEQERPLILLHPQSQPAGEYRELAHALSSRLKETGPLSVSRSD